ncbi:MAG TPA: phosphatase PAP2 family protein [Candidatus Paceibacterota bacterium]|nr:phosphatase PAP2 family protein [Candidatus Paceibacterota bacterium]
MSKTVRLATFVDRITSPIVFAGFVLFACVFLYFEGNLQEAKILILSFVATIFVTGILKITLKKDRRSDALILLNDYAFPSGHASGAVSFAFAISYILMSINLPRADALVGVIFMIALCIGISRVLIRVHTRIEVYAGVAIGILVPLLVIMLLE